MQRRQLPLKDIKGIFTVGYQLDTRSMPRLTDALIRKLPAPTTTKRTLTSDDKVDRLKVQVTCDGAISFVIRYSIDGRQRLYTIGRFPDWSTEAAREEAKHLLRLVDQGIDPKQHRDSQREAPLVRDLCTRYLTEYGAKKRTEYEDRRMIERWVLPELGGRKVASVSYSDIDRLHRKLTTTSVRKKCGGTPYQANRVLAMLSKMFSLATHWQMRSDNPCKGIQRNLEERRYRYLNGDELRRLTEALAVHPNRSAANAVRLLLLTGARRGEVLGATWSQFDLTSGIWTKPPSATKQKFEHRIPLSAPAQQLLVEIRAAAEARAKEMGHPLSPYVFPARIGNGPMREIKWSWISLCRAAGISGVRVHDLRHTYASVLASSGLSLPVIGALLGHTQPGTTARYAHLFDDPLRVATEQAGAIISGSSDGHEPAAGATLRRS